MADADLDVYLGDSLEWLRELPDDSVQMCVTSPPFYGLRDYGVDGQIGLEASLEEWVAALVAVFAEVRRVMHPSGTLWLELADSHVTSRSKGDNVPQSKMPGRTYPKGAPHRSRTHAGLKPKDLMGAPFEVAMALRADGWYWRQTIIWHKRQAMPESAPDRPTTSHSYVFLMSTSRRYYYDDEAIAEPAEWARWGDQSAGKYGDEAAMSKASMVKTLTREQIRQRFGGGRQRGAGREGAYKTTDERNARFQGPGSATHATPGIDPDPLFDYEGGEPGEKLRRGWHDHSADLEAGNGKQRAADGRPAGTVRYDGWKEEVDAGGGLTRRGRSLWSLSAEPNRLAVCSVCEAYWNGDHPEQHCGVDVVQHYAAFPRELARRAISAGSRQGDVVLDPFGGSGTTAMAARELGRKAVLIELRREYAVMIRERTKQWSLLGG